MNKTQKWLGALSLLGFLVCGVGLAQTLRTATTSWSAVTQDTDGNTVTGVKYRVYSGPRGGAKTLLIDNIAGTSQVVSGLPAGEVCFELTAFTAAGGESAHTGEACKSFPFAAPKSPGSFQVQ